MANGMLEKMSFHFFKNTELTSIAAPPIEVMYNPKSLSLAFSNDFDKGEKTQTGTQTQKFSTKNPRNLSLTLTFDGTGASPSKSIIGQKLEAALPSLPDINLDVHHRIKIFMESAFRIEGENHVPNNIVVVWGKLFFPCVLTSASVNYKLFKLDGTPLRAELQVSLLEQKNQYIDNKATNLLSPDLTRGYMVKEGDRLDALCDKFYKDSTLYHEVARVNNIKNYRKLTPGEMIKFPPIDKRN
jgi:hypothetical protein